MSAPNAASVLITGASSGIGRAFADHYAASGAPLVLAARRTSKLESAAAALRLQHDARVEVLPTDLSTADGPRELLEQVQSAGLQVSTLINNAGVGAHGDVAASDPDELLSQIRLNVLAVTELTTRVLPAMIAQGQGTIINVASTAAFQPVPHMAVYAATKAYVLSFSRALWAETRGTGVRVLALCPGATDTEFFDHTGPAASVGSRRSPEQVVRTAVRALARHSPSTVDGAGNRWGALLAPRIPERAAIAIAERSVRP